MSCMVAAHAGKGAYDVASALHNLDGILLTWHSSEHGLHFDVKWKPKSPFHGKSASEENGHQLDKPAMRPSDSVCPLVSRLLPDY
jgi:hypothetical protein